MQTHTHSLLISSAFTVLEGEAVMVSDAAGFKHWVSNLIFHQWDVVWHPDKESEHPWEKAWMTFLGWPYWSIPAEEHVQCFTKQDVLLFLCMGFQNCPMIYLYSLQISGLKVYSRCGTVHLWMFGKMLWSPAARTQAQAAWCSVESTRRCLLWLCPLLWALSWAGLGSKASGSFSPHILSEGYSLGWQFGGMVGGGRVLSGCTGTQLPTTVSGQLRWTWLFAVCMDGATMTESPGEGLLFALGFCQPLENASLSIREYRMLLCTCQCCFQRTVTWIGRN